MITSTLNLPCAAVYSNVLLLTQQNACSISNLPDPIWLLDSDSVVSVFNYRQYGDYTAIGSSVTMLPAVINVDYTVTVQSLPTRWLTVTDEIGILLCANTIDFNVFQQNQLQVHARHCHLCNWTMAYIRILTITMSTHAQLYKRIMHTFDVQKTFLLWIPGLHVVYVKLSHTLFQIFL